MVRKLRYEVENDEDDSDDKDIKAILNLQKLIIY